MVTTRFYCSHSCSCFLSGKWNKRILLWEGGLTGKEITLIASSIYSPFKRIHIPLLDPPSVTTPLSIHQHVILISHIEEIDDTESWSRFQMHMKSREFISLLITCLVWSFIHKSIKAFQDRDNRQEPSLFYQFFVVVFLSSTRKEATKASNKQCKQTNEQPPLGMNFLRQSLTFRHNNSKQLHSKSDQPAAIACCALGQCLARQ